MSAAALIRVNTVLWFWVRFSSLIGNQLVWFWFFDTQLKTPLYAELSSEESN